MMQVKVGYGIFNCEGIACRDLMKTLSSQRFKEFIKYWISGQPVEEFNEILAFLNNYRLISDGSLRFPVLNESYSRKFIEEAQNLTLIILPELIAFLEKYSNVERIVVLLGELDTALDLSIIEHGIRPIKIKDAEVFVWVLLLREVKKPAYFTKISESNQMCSIRVEIGVPEKVIRLENIEKELTYKHSNLKKFADNFLALTREKAEEMVLCYNFDADKTCCYIYGFTKTVYDICVNKVLEKNLIPRNIAVEYSIYY